MIVAIVALVFAVAGTSVAAINSLSKKQKQQTRRIAQDEIGKAAPGLSVAKAGSATNATNAADAAHATQADSVPGGSIGPGQLSAAIPAVHVTRTGTPESTDGGAAKTLTFNSERYDTAGMFDGTTPSSRLTAPIKGVYQVTAQINWESAASSEHELFIIRNGSTPIAARTEETTGGAQTATTQVRLQAGDFVEAQVFQDSANGVHIELQPEYSPEFSMTWLAPGP
jgi:hypothetical protein